MPASAAAANAAVPKLFAYNSSPLALPSFLEFLRNDIPSAGANYRSLLRSLTITTTGNRPRTVCTSIAHLITVRDSLLPVYDFDKLPPQPMVDFEVMCRKLISDANAAACLLAGVAPGKFDYPYPSASDSKVMACSDADYAALPLTAEDKEEFITSRSQIDNHLYELALRISSFYTIESSGRSAASLASNNGILLIYQLAEKRDKIEARAGAALTREWLQHCSIGLQSADLDIWLRFYERAEAIQLQLPPDRKSPNSVLATMYADKVREQGSDMSDREGSWKPPLLLTCQAN